jgi:hypothetical protein
MLTATITSSAGTVNEGNITFTIYNGTIVVGTPIVVPVIGGMASGIYALPGGTPGGPPYKIVASFGGSTDFATSGDSSDTLTVNPAIATVTASAASVTLTSSGSAQSVTLTANVKSTAGTVNEGTVTFTILDGTTVIGTAISPSVVAGTASGTYMVPAGTAFGTYTIKAVYSGTGNFTTSTDMSQSLAVNSSGAPTTVSAVEASASFGTADQKVTLNINITSTAGQVNEGTVTFTILSGTTLIGTAVTANVAAGSASAKYTIPAGTAPGTYTIKAVYNGTANFQSSMDTNQHLTISEATVTVTAAAVTATYGTLAQSITLSATVTSTAGVVNEGSVTFTLLTGSTVVGTPVMAMVTAGAASASFNLPAGTAVGSYSVHADYGGTPNLMGGMDHSQNLAVGTATSTTTVHSASSTFSLTQDQSAPVMATVSSPAGPVNEGTETFTVLDQPFTSGPGMIQTGGAPGSFGPFLVSVIGKSVTVPVTNGVAMGSYTIPAGTAAGTYTLQAQYNGDANLVQSPYSTQAFVVNAAATTTAAQSATATYSAADQTVMLSANVTSMAGTVAAGQATFELLGNASASADIAPDAETETGTVIGTPVLVNVAGGALSTPYTVPGGTAAGTYSIEVDFGGTNDFVKSSDTTQQLTIQQAPTTTMVTVAALPFSHSDSTVTVSAAVSSAAGTVDGGSVTFKILKGSNPVGTPVMASITAGSASTSVTVPGNTPADVYTLEADFGGTTNFQMSSGTTSLTVSAADAAATITTAASSTTPFSAANQTVGLSASVTSTAPVNGGTVIFTLMNGSTPIGTPVPAPVSAGAATASYVVPAGTVAGGYTIQADYVGTVNLLNSGDSAHALTVAPAATAVAAMNATATYSPSDQTVPLTASITGGAATVATGTVMFTIESGSTPIGNPITEMVSGGTAGGNYTLPGGTAAGTYTIVASYSGTSNLAMSNDMAHTLVVAPAPVSAMVAAPAEALTPKVGQTVALSSQLSTAAGPITGGTETFSVLSGSAVIGTPVTVGVQGGSASASYILPVGTPPGTYTIKAAYSGSADYAGLTDTSQSLTLPVTLMSLAITPSSSSVVAGTNQQFMATGTYSDGSTQNLTADVTWASGSPGVAGISNASGSQGLASGAAAGSSTITASLGNDSTMATLNVTAASSSGSGSGSGSGGGTSSSQTPPQVMGSFTTTHTKKGLSAISITFNESLNSASATSAALYHVFSGVKKKGKTLYTKPVAIGSIQYADGPHQVTLNLKKPFKGAVQVMVQGSIMAANSATANVQASMIVR